MNPAAGAGVSRPDGPQDVLESGGGPRGRGGRLLLLVPAALLSAALLLDRQGDREVSALLDRAETGAAAVEYADGRVAGLVRYAAPALLSAQVDARVRSGLEDLVRAEAAGQVDDLRAERDAAAAVRVLPWHGRQRAARDRWVDYLDARVAYLEAVAADFDELYRPHPELLRARAAAGRAYRAVAPDEGARLAAVLGD